MVAANYRVLVLSEAIADVQKISDHIAVDSPQSAAAVVDYLWKALQSLTDFPHRYAVKRHKDDPRKAVRLMPAPPFVVYYRIDERRQVVRILSVRHGRQRRPRTFE